MTRPNKNFTLENRHRISTGDRTDTKRYPNRLKFSLTKGYTIDTIKEPIAFDFVYNDAGHKYESVLHDWNMVNKSKMIVFDDYVLPGVKKVLDLHVSPNNAIEAAGANNDTSEIENLKII